MADVGDERVTFGKLTKFHSQYGTTSSAASTRVDNAYTFILHTVQFGDTLQGIAVKYGVAVSIFHSSSAAEHAAFCFQSLLKTKTCVILYTSNSYHCQNWHSME